MGKIAETLFKLGSKIEQGLGVASTKTREAAHNVYDVTVGQSIRDNVEHEKNDNLYDAYKEYRRQKSGIHGDGAKIEFIKELQKQGKDYNTFMTEILPRYEKVRR